MFPEPGLYVVWESMPNEEGSGFKQHMIVAEHGSFEKAELDRQAWLRANPTLYYTIEKQTQRQADDRWLAEYSLWAD